MRGVYQQHLRIRRTEVQNREYATACKMTLVLPINGATDSERALCLQTQKAARNRMFEREALGM